MRPAKYPRQLWSLKVKQVRRLSWNSLPSAWRRTREFANWSLLTRFPNPRPERFCGASWYKQIEGGKKRMSPEVIAKTVKEYFAALRAMDQNAWVNTFAEDGISYDPVGAQPINGHEKLAEFFQTITAAFKEVGLTEDHVFIAGNSAAVKWTGRGTSKQGRAVH